MSHLPEGLLEEEQFSFFDEVARVAVTSLTRAVTMVLGLVVGILTARLLGPEGRGEYYFTITLASLVGQFANLGVHSSNSYLVAQDPSRFRSLLANSIWISLIVGGGAAMFSVLLVHYNGISGKVPLRLLTIGMILVPACMVFLFGTNLLMAVRKIKAYNASQLLSHAVVLVAIVIAIQVAPTVTGMLLAAAFAWIASAAVLALYLFAQVGFSLRFDGPVFRQGVLYAFRAYLACLLGFLLLRGNVFLLQRLSTSAEVGYYSIASQLSDVLVILPQTVAMILFPRLVKNTETGWSRTRKTLLIVCLVMIVGEGLCALIAPVLITKAFGKSFEPAVQILYSMLPGVLALGLTSIVSQYLASLGFPKQVVVLWLLAVPILVISGCLLIPTYAGKGAGIAFSFTYAVLFLAILVVAWLKNRHLQANDQKSQMDAARSGNQWTTS